MTRRRTRSLQRLVEDSGAAAWLIDSTGSIVYVSPAMAEQLRHPAESFLDRSTDPPAATSNDDVNETAGVPGTIPPVDPIDRLAALLGVSPTVARRGHETRELWLPSGDGQSLPVAAHWVQIDADPPLILGTLGNHRLDSELDPADLEGPTGIPGRAAIAQAVDRWQQRHGELSTALLLGQSSAAAVLRRRSEVAAAVRCSVTIVGGPGCGWRSLAERIHAASAPGEPLASIDGSLMDAELIAVYAGPIAEQIDANRSGRGTLLIDRVEDLPADAAGVLGGWVTRFGDRLRLIGRQRKSEVASVLPAALATPLSTLRLTIPPLTDRPTDLPAIVQTLTRQAAAGAPPAWSAEAMHRLSVYPWPHQYDELVDVVGQTTRRCLSGSSGHRTISTEHLPLLVRSYRTGAPPSASDPVPLVGDQPPASLDDQLAALELNLIREAVEASGGNKAEAARRLGISRARLLRRLEP